MLSYIDYFIAEIVCRLVHIVVVWHSLIFHHVAQASQVDVEELKATALKSTFDIVMLYGFGAFESAQQQW